MKRNIILETDTVVLFEEGGVKSFQLKGRAADKVWSEYNNTGNKLTHLEILFDIDVDSYYKLKSCIAKSSKLYDPKNDVCEFGPSKDKYFRW